VFKEFELIYVYINDIGRTFNKQEICLSNDYIASFKEGKLTITEVYNPYKQVWGDYISSVNLLIGRNGTGKTTMIDLLGTERRRKRNNEKFSKLSWFALYRKDESEYIIEGNDKNLIKNIEQPRNQDDEYCIVCTYDYTNNRFKNIRFIQNEKWEDKITYLTYHDDITCSWSKKENYYDDDTAFSFYRNRLGMPDYDHIYSFISKEIKYLDENNATILNAPNLECTLVVNTDKYLINTRIEYLKNSTKKQEFIINLMNAVVELYLRTKHEESSQTKLLEYSVVDYETAKKFYLEDIGKEIFKLADVVDQIEKLDDKYFNGNDSGDDNSFRLRLSCRQFSINMRQVFDSNIDRLLKVLKYNDLFLRAVNIEFSKLSMGELEFINLFSNIYDGIEKASRNKSEKNLILLLDEPGKGFHPEWSRRFISYLYHFSNYLGEKYKCRFQYLITTHSPFMISDIPKRNIHRFVNEDGWCTIKKSTKGLMSNIHDIMKDDFYIEAPIGHFAEELFKKLQEDIKLIKHTEEEKDVIKRIEYIISDIDERILSFKLSEILHNHINEIVRNNPEQRRLRIKKLEKELSELKKYGDGNQ